MKGEHTAKGANPRYIVTNLSGAPKRLYDQVYCLFSVEVGGRNIKLTRADVFKGIHIHHCISVIIDDTDHTRCDAAVSAHQKVRGGSSECVTVQFTFIPDHDIEYPIGM